MVTLERFSLVALCPNCGAVDTHDMAEPRLEPPPCPDGSPVEQVQRRLSMLLDAFSIVTAGGGLFDPPGTEVARVCRACNHRWGQR